MSSDNELVYLGGSFDPVHIGHYQMILSLSKRYKKVIIIPTVNYMKGESKFPLLDRINALNFLCKQLPNIEVLNMAEWEDTTSTYKVANILMEKYGCKPDIAMGSDCLNTIDRWIDYSKLKAEYKFYIFIRDGFLKDIGLNYESEVVEISNVSSSEIKKSLQIELIPESIRQFFQFS